MDISIDLRYFKQISFGNLEIEMDMIESWKEDGLKRIAELEINVKSQNQKIIFDNLHALKTNFSMVNCYAGIKSCEILLDDIQKNRLIDSSNLIQLEKILKQIILTVANN